MKAVLALVGDDNIVVLCESRLKMPPTIAEEIRKVSKAIL
jgi:20S proteasome alpha/beta subunit